MKRGDLVGWKLQTSLGLPHGEIGLVISQLSYEDRGRDPFPWWNVLFSGRGWARCRESDLVVV